MPQRRVLPPADAAPDRGHPGARTRLMAAAGAALAAGAVAWLAGGSDAAVPAAAGTVAGPVAPRIDAFSGPVANGASQNELYLFVAAHAGQIVRISVQITAPVQAVTRGDLRALTLSSGCGGRTAPANCARAPELAQATYAIRGADAAAGSTVTNADGRYTVSGYFAVGQAARDARGGWSVPLRALALGGPGSAGEDDQ